jgi:hypothetical protein
MSEWIRVRSGAGSTSGSRATAVKQITKELGLTDPRDVAEAQG